MKLSAKTVIAALAVASVVVIGFREFSAGCTPPKADEHGHGHGHGEKEEGHGSESLGTKVCEDGLLTALWEKFGSSTETAKANSEAPKEEAHGEGGHAHGEGKEGEEAEGLVKLSAAQIKAAGIEMAPAISGTLRKEIAVPGRVAMNADTQARVVPKLTGTVASIKKQLGDTVAKDDLLATIDSREMADAKAEYLGASRSEELARSTYEREERLWKQKVTAEQDYLTARNGHAEAKIKLDVAHQRLHAIGLSDEEVANLSKAADESGVRIYELRAPIAGQITSRDLVLGQTVGTDKEVFVIADPSKVWVEMAVPPNDLSFARQGQDVRIQSGTKSAVGKIVALSPNIDPETRSAKAIAELDNSNGAWKPGDYVDARLIAAEQNADVVVPKDAIQSAKGTSVVFVNEKGGFRLRPVVTGRQDSVHVEVLSGLEFGETVATKNTFTLKAELGKAEAEHEH